MIDVVDKNGDHVLVLNGDVRDYLVYRKGSGPTVEIYDIQVGSERRKGKGRELVNELVTSRLLPGTKLVWAITRVTNPIAGQFYLATGFRTVAVLADFYGSREHAVMYGRDV